MTSCAIEIEKWDSTKRFSQKFELEVTSEGAVFLHRAAYSFYITATSLAESLCICNAGPLEGFSTLCTVLRRFFDSVVFDLPCIFPRDELGSNLPVLARNLLKDITCFASFCNGASLWLLQQEFMLWQVNRGRSSTKVFLITYS